MLKLSLSGMIIESLIESSFQRVSGSLAGNEETQAGEIIGSDYRCNASAFGNKVETIEIDKSKKRKKKEQR